MSSRRRPGSSVGLLKLTSLFVLVLLFALAPPALAQTPPADSPDTDAAPADTAEATAGEIASTETEGATPPEAEPAPPAPDESEARLSELEKQIRVLADELERAKTNSAVPEERDLESRHGLGPAASKVYLVDGGLSIGGYGEVAFAAPVGDANPDKPDAIFDALRAVLYVGYKYNEKWVLNSEFEFEHAGTSGGGSVSTEFLTLDYLATDYLAARVGLLLVPMGLVNEMHEPNTFYGTFRPMVEQRIIPSTWRENGAGLFGTINDLVQYRAYAINGLEASGFSASGLRGGRQKGSKALANHWAFVARADVVDLVDGLMFGGSVYTGKSGQNQDNTFCDLSAQPVSCVGEPGYIPGTPLTTTTLDIPDTLTTIYELHAEYRRWGLTVRGLFTQAFLQDTALLNAALNNGPNDSIAEQMLGAYVDVGYDIMPIFLDETRMSLEPFFRYERVDTQNVMASGLRNDKYVQDIYTTGLNFKPIPQIVLKVDYRAINPRSDKDDVWNAVNASVGYVF